MKNIIITSLVLLLIFGLYNNFKNPNNITDNNIVNNYYFVINKDTLQVLDNDTNKLIKNTLTKDTAKVKERQNKKITQYKISNKGKEFIKKHESLELNRYLIKGEKLYTIGYGHQIRPDENIGKSISKSKANQLFDKDILYVEEATNRIIQSLDDRFEFSQGFVDGLCSLVYNCGEQGVLDTQLYARLKACRFDKNGNVNQNDFDYALAAVKTSKVFLPGHKTRRLEEYKLMID